MVSLTRDVRGRSPLRRPERGRERGCPSGLRGVRLDAAVDDALVGAEVTHLDGLTHDERSHRGLRVRVGFGGAGRDLHEQVLPLGRAAGELGGAGGQRDAGDVSPDFSAVTKEGVRRPCPVPAGPFADRRVLWVLGVWLCGPESGLQAGDALSQVREERGLCDLGVSGGVLLLRIGAGRAVWEGDHAGGVVV